MLKNGTRSADGVMDAGDMMISVPIYGPPTPAVAVLNYWYVTSDRFKVARTSSMRSRPLVLLR